MAFCYYSKEDEDKGFINVESSFIREYLDDCSGEQLKVYLFGLYLCSMPLSKDNSIEHMCDALSLSEEKVLSAFSYWEEKGLITIFSYDPLQVQYHSTKKMAVYRTYKKEKYADFNAQLEAIFSDRFISNPNQYTVYYDFIETSNISTEVLIMIIQYCVSIKGKSVSNNYILQVAKSWINDGIRTIQAVEDRIKQRELSSSEIREIAVAIGKTSAITEEDKDFYTKWTETWGFRLPGILAACKKSLKTMNKLDSTLDDCFRNNAISAAEVDEYLKNKKKISSYAIDISNALGQWYDNPTPIIENYILPWLQKGYAIDGLMIIAKYCFRNSLKKFEQMDHLVNTLLKDGIITDDDIKEYFDNQQLSDDSIKKVLETLGTSRNVNLSDRDMFNLWTKDWGFSVPVIIKTAEPICGKTMGDLTRRLSLLKQNNIFDVEGAEAFFEKPTSTKASRAFNENDRKYNKEDEANLLDEEDLDDIKM